MTSSFSELTALSDQALASAIARLAARERHATGALIAALAEFDARKLYLPAGCASLFTYCTQVLHLSEHAAYNRIEAARAARRFPALFEQLVSGSLTLTAVRLLAPHLTEANHRELFERARHKSKRDLEELVATLRPQPDAPPLIRKLPATSQPRRLALADEAPSLVAGTRGCLGQAADPVQTAPSQKEPPLEPVLSNRGASSRPAVIAPIAPDRYKVQFTVSREVHDKLRRAQNLLRHTLPHGGPAEIFDRALSLLLKELERRKAATAQRPHPATYRPQTHPVPTRHIPAAVRREVWARDAGRCAFVGTAGRCTERGLLEFHHLLPFADGGPSTPVNLQLRCRRHNQHEADRWAGHLSPSPLFDEC